MVERRGAGIIGAVSRFEDRDWLLEVESQLGALVGVGHSRTDATMVMIERIATEARDATTVVLVGLRLVSD